MWILTAAAVLAAPLTESPVVLDVEQPSWSADFDFGDGPAFLDLDLSGTALEHGSRLMIAVDGERAAALSFTGTPVPRTVPLGALQGPHKVTLTARLQEEGFEDCDPGDPWLRIDLDSEVRGASRLDDRRPQPRELASTLADEPVHLVGGTNGLWLETATLLHAWGAALDGDAWTIEVEDSDTRSIDVRGRTIFVAGDAVFVRSLHEPEVLNRCGEWPCLFGTGDMLLPDWSERTTLGDAGYQRGLVLTGRDRAEVVFAVERPPRSAVLRLEVDVPQLVMDDASRLDVLLDGQPLGTWSVDRLDGQEVLEVELPAWAMKAQYWRFALQANLRGHADRCEREALPWIRIGARSGIVTRDTNRDGLAGAAQRLRSLDVARVCFETHVDPEVARILSPVRPHGGWEEDCEAPDVRVTADLPAGFEVIQAASQASDSDPVSRSLDRWVVAESIPLLVHAPQVRGTVEPLPWFALDADRAVSTRIGWSALELRTSLEPIEGDGLATDAVEADENLDLWFGLLACLLLFAGAVWIWRSRGDRSGWLEDESPA